MDGCEKQAQGNFDRMCKSHFKAMKRATTPLPKVTNLQHPPPAQGMSVYDEVLPASISYVPSSASTSMPLIDHLKAGFFGSKPPAWHRNEERRSRGMFPIDNPATQLEGWERELVWMEILVLTGAPDASFRHLARAWGRDKGFHMVLAQFICGRHGDVQRKKRQAEAGNDATADAYPNASTNKNTTNAAAVKRGPAKKRKLIRKAGGNHKRAPGVISADIWDDSCYGDVDTNEALAADIFNFSAQEFESAAFKKWKKNPHAYDNDAAASTAPYSPQSLASTVAVTALLNESASGSGGGGAPVPVLPTLPLAPAAPPPQATASPPSSSSLPQVHDHPEQHPGTSAMLDEPPPQEQLHHAQDLETSAVPVEHQHAPQHPHTDAPHTHVSARTDHPEQDPETSAALVDYQHPAPVTHDVAAEQQQEQEQPPPTHHLNHPNREFV
jgi:hypothetical protein